MILDYDGYSIYTSIDLKQSNCQKEEGSLSHKQEQEGLTHESGVYLVMALKLDYDYYEGQLLCTTSSYFQKPNYLPKMRNTYKVRERTCLVCQFQLRVKALVQDMRETFQINLHT